MKTEPQTIGLIAGNGKFPFLLAREAGRQGRRVVAAAIQGDTSFLLRFFVSRLAWFRPGDLRKLFAYFKENGVRDVIMAGQVNPDNLFDRNVKMDEEFRALFEALENRKADTIFSAIAERLKANGMELLDSTTFLKDYMARKGTLTRRGPTLPELEDITFGLKIAKSMGGMDIGQTVVVKDRAVVAIEAMEGTDRCILRGGTIAREGAVVVKASKPNQDQRFDVPVIGPRTIKTMARCQARCLAVESGKTLIINESQCLQMANRLKMTVVAV